MRPAAFPTHYWLGFVLALLGCQPEIGDSCQIHSDCSASGDRLCDPTLPGGYCTLFNCEPGGCPEEAVCVAYNTVMASAPECGGDSSRIRTFCMKSCSSGGDCRRGDGYDCVDLSKKNPWGAQVVERGSHRQKVCTMPFDEKANAKGRETDVCQGDGGPEPMFLPHPDAGPRPGEGGPPDGGVEAGEAGKEAGAAEAGLPEAAAPESGAGEAGTGDADVRDAQEGG